ncbi:hypothetical protein N9355_04085 [Crocinitomicaceae bacterium]|nr:hypothetical protein [Crocinitomicaceae bacterium]
MANIHILLAENGCLKPSSTRLITNISVEIRRNVQWFVTNIHVIINNWGLFDQIFTFD